MLFDLDKSGKILKKSIFHVASYNCLSNET